MRSEVVVIPAKKTEAEKRGVVRLRVAAYCRVSTDEERQLDSFENQVVHYNDYINANAGYELIEVYSDEGISGCSTKHRDGFLRMIDDCMLGKIDLIITKSISRFARNTQDSLLYTRRLKDMGVGVIFEKEGINTLESSGELLLTLFSCFAQEESRSISENTSWGIRSRFKQGIPHINAQNLLGYDKDENGVLVVNDSQAETVRRIYSLFLEGFSLNGIASMLNKEGVPGVRGEPKWCATTLGRVIANEKYKGAMMMQKTFTVDFLTRKNALNEGKLNKYYIEEDHEPVVPKNVWEAAQEETERRRSFRQKHGLKGLTGGCDSPFYSRLFCGRCGGVMKRVFPEGMQVPVWCCFPCRARLKDDVLRRSFVEAFNRTVDKREELMPRWSAMKESGTALEGVRGEQMIELTGLGKLEHEVPEITRVLLGEAELTGKTLAFTFLSGDREELFLY